MSPQTGALEGTGANVSLSGALAEAAWAEADFALAQALADLDEVDAAANESERATALDMLRQSLARAARKRGLSRLGELGAREAYDPDRHELAASGKPKAIVIGARGVARGPDVLVKPRVSLVWAHKKRP